MCTQNIVDKRHIIFVGGREFRRKNGGLRAGRRFNGKEERGSGGIAIKETKIL